MARLVTLAGKVLFGLVLLVALIAAGGWTYLMLAYPRVMPASALRVAGTPEQVARGQYLSHHVVGCTDCHGERDWSKYSAPQRRDREGQGGMTFRLDIGTLRAPNITPAAIGNWTDGELLRAMTEGVTRDGRPLFPFMPYDSYRLLAQDDAEALIAYVRTLPAVKTDIPRSTLRFPFNLIVRTLPSPATLPRRAPDRADRVAYGRYLATIGSCVTCHTLMRRGQPVEGMTYAGGLEFRTREGRVQYSANITPDATTGIGNWTEAMFIERFKMIADLPEAELALNGRANTEMPWRDYGGMTREDLGAIYAFLRTVPAVRHAIKR